MWLLPSIYRFIIKVIINSFFMITTHRTYLVWLRIAIGWLFLYAGLTKVFDSSWSAAGYLNSAKSFHGLYAWFATDANIGWVNFVNEWGLTIIGVLLILGIWVRWASWGGVVLMVLYYFPVLDFPKAGEHSFLIDEHIIYILVLLVVASMDPALNKGKEWFKKLMKM